MTRGSELTRRLIQGIKMLVAVAIGAVLIYRGHAYNDAHGPGLLVPVMCVLSALTLVGTALAMIFGPREAF